MGRKHAFLNGIWINFPGFFPGATTIVLWVFSVLLLTGATYVPLHWIDGRGETIRETNAPVLKDAPDEGRHATVGRSLVRIDGRTHKIEPDLAIFWTQTSTQTMRFVLRQNARFSNGMPVSADDVVYSLRPSQVKAFTLSRSNGGSIKRIVKINDRTVDIAFHTIERSSLQSLAHLRIEQKATTTEPNALEQPTPLPAAHMAASLD